ncbi:MAG TPA: CO dehydrogenase/acetyl-CoA synthase complex subunit epsilon [Methanophagales archaeon]|nr:CO dehydrogenase/acetyl-CoA synthase complex subunit epsilon [Methanophagales archaeon]
MVLKDAPWQTANVPGPKQAKILTPLTAAKMIKRAKRPLFIVGSLVLETELNGKSLMDYAIEIAKESKMPTVAVAHTVKEFMEKEFQPDASMPVINIIDRLRDADWKGVKGEGQHDRVVFLGVLYYIGSQGLSTLKHFAPWLRTITLCRFFHPNADMSFPNMSDEEWESYLNEVTEKLKRS